MEQPKPPHSSIRSRLQRTILGPSIEPTRLKRSSQASISSLRARARFQTPASSGGTFRFQLISPSSPYLSLNQSLAFLKCPHSNQPFCALSGLGWTLFKSRCLPPISLPWHLFCAGDPQARKTTPRVRCFATASITFCVNRSQPLPAWELASCARTVSTVFRSSTPRSAHGVKRPPFLGGAEKEG